MSKHMTSFMHVLVFVEYKHAKGIKVLNVKCLQFKNFKGSINMHVTRVLSFKYLYAHAHKRQESSKNGHMQGKLHSCIYVG